MSRTRQPQAGVIITLDWKARCSPMTTEGAETARRTMRLTSFGFKYGIPQDSSYVFDVRFIPNPFYVPELKPLSGKDEAVMRYLKTFAETDEFLAACGRLLDFVVPRYLAAGKARLHIAVGCTGGRHRSVAFVEWLFERYKEAPGADVDHRDIDKAP